MKKVIIMGAAGRDFHNFNTYFRDNKEYKVVCFTATQIPNIEDRRYPKELAGELYPEGIPIHPEEELEDLIEENNVSEVVFAYSDVSHEYVMHKASLVLKTGADFVLMGLKNTQLKSKKPVISVCAVRTGSGKSQTTRRILDILKNKKVKAAVVRHPMAYGNLVKQKVQKFASYEDLDRHECTIEEREEYEPLLARNATVFAGVDYEEILRKAEEEADIILWDGGNNDIPFFESNLHIIVADPLRAGDEISYHPGETNLRMADVVVINKIDSSYPEDVDFVRESVKLVNPKAKIIEAASPIFVDSPEKITGKKILVVEDGPTVTHGGMGYGAGFVAAERFGGEVIDPREYAVGSIKKTFEEYNHLLNVLPAMGYGKEQIEELEKTINRSECDTVVIGTPIDLRRLIKINKDAVRVRYELQEIGKPNLEDVLVPFLKGIG